MKREINKYEDKGLRLFILGAMFFSGSAVSITNVFINQLELAFLLALIVYLLIKHNFKIKKNFYNSKLFLNLIIILFFAFASSIWNGTLSSFSSTGRFIMSVVLAFILSNEYDKKTTLTAYVKVMRFLATISIIGFLLFNTVHLPYSWMPILTKTTDARVAYRSILIYNILQNYEYRNCGPFWEPSIFAAYLIIALVIDHFFISDRKESSNTLIFIIAIITTFSTGGFVLLACYFMMRIYSNKRSSVVVQLISIIAIFVIYISVERVSELLLTLNYDVFSKLINFTDSKSSMTRFYSVIINFNIWLKNIVFGVGFKEMDSHYVIWRNILAPSDLAPAQTSTTTLYLATMGIGGIYLNYLWIKLSFINNLQIIQKILFFLMLIFILNETPHLYFVWTYFLMFAMLKETNIKKAGE